MMSGVYIVQFNHGGLMAAGGKIKKFDIGKKNRGKIA